MELPMIPPQLLEEAAARRALSAQPTQQPPQQAAMSPKAVGAEPPTMLAIGADVEMSPSGGKKRKGGDGAEASSSQAKRATATAASSSGKGGRAGQGGKGGRGRGSHEDIVGVMARLTLRNDQEVRLLKSAACDSVMLPADHPLLMAAREGGRRFLQEAEAHKARRQAAYDRGDSDEQQLDPPHLWSWNEAVAWLRENGQIDAGAGRGGAVRPELQAPVQWPRGVRRGGQGVPGAEHPRRPHGAHRCVVGAGHGLDDYMAPHAPRGVDDGGVLQRGQAPQGNLARQVQSWLSDKTQKGRREEEELR